MFARVFVFRITLIASSRALPENALPKLLRVERVDEIGGLIVYVDSDISRCDASKLVTIENVYLVNRIAE